VKGSKPKFSAHWLNSGRIVANPEVPNRQLPSGEYGHKDNEREDSGEFRLLPKHSEDEYQFNSGQLSTRRLDFLLCIRARLQPGHNSPKNKGSGFSPCTPSPCHKSRASPLSAACFSPEQTRVSE
jgi:hypothetical protein